MSWHIPHTFPRRWLYYSLPALFILAALLCFLVRQGRESASPTVSTRDYAQIKATGILRAVTEYDPVGYYASGDTVAGFHYELLQAFAQAHGLQVALQADMSLNDQLEGLATGRYDLIAASLPVTSELKDSLLFTVPIVLNRQVLVQRKDTSRHDSLCVQSQLDLAGKTLHVAKDSPATLRINNLGDEIGDTIYIREIELYGAEQLIAMVAHGDIDYAVCDENIAQAVADSLPQIDISVAIGFTQFHSWAVGKHSPALLDSLDSWLTSYKQGNRYKALCRKYDLQPCL